ncbi:hypothetical protein Poly51_17890 [Rubripirellula tenax]|uniref:Alpha-L-glutamate ligase-related protein ATP-grasp domain-containing protein n=1 Tax=Rubripirellula tenax TaxID=2528015 RepID=A0A5C6FFL0_9BACT|nr:sugar-transfer associated ATP-grasp domain-containing protein [Rubripirellula tenax]TWU59004.1 hypothetical protein Poly51_17890 [Rubripirellula tenax]
MSTENHADVSQAEPAFQFDYSDSSSSDLIQGFRKAKAAGKGMLGMFLEMTKLRRGIGKISADEYFLYGLYDDRRYSPEIKKSFLGGSGRMVDSPWTILANDKPLMTAMLKGLGLPVPETQAMVHAHRTAAGVISLRNRADIGRFLRNDAQYPIFGKPFDAGCSLGTAKITGYDSANDVVVVGDERIAVDTFSGMISKLGRNYLFQTLLLPHEEISARIGPCVSSVRMFVINDSRGCTLHRAAWKIPASANVADNFWRAGNMLAGIDAESGRVIKTMLRSENGIAPVDAHPGTGVSFTDMVFPQWDQMRKTVLAAATQLTRCPFQGWDVALTDQGPILVELEADGGNPIMEQLCFESGLLDARYLNAVAEHKAWEKDGRKPVSVVNLDDGVHIEDDASAANAAPQQANPASPVIAPITVTPVVSNHSVV